MLKAKEVKPMKRLIAVSITIVLALCLYVVALPAQPAIAVFREVKLLASDGARLASFLVGGNPLGVIFDGTNIWVANGLDNTVSKVRPSDGEILGTFPVGTTPGGMAFDGANIWVANYTTNNVTKLRASDGANLGTFGAGTHPALVAFDGANIWVTNYGDNTVTKF